MLIFWQRCKYHASPHPNSDIQLNSVHIDQNNGAMTGGADELIESPPLTEGRMSTTSASLLRMRALEHPDMGFVTFQAISL